MAIFVDGQEIKQIIIGPDKRIAKVYYGGTLVWETSKIFEDNKPNSATVTLTPGIYELYCVGGGGGSAGAGGGGGGGDESTPNTNPIGGS